MHLIVDNGVWSNSILLRWNTTSCIIKPFQFRVIEYLTMTNRNPLLLALVAELVRASISWYLSNSKVEGWNPGHPEKIYIFRNAEIRMEFRDLLRIPNLPFGWRHTNSWTDDAMGWLTSHLSWWMPNLLSEWRMDLTCSKQSASRSWVCRKRYRKSRPKSS